MATLTTTPDEVQALLQLVQRAPMTRAEALFADALFTGWLAQLGAPNAPGGAAASDVLAQGAPATQPPTISTSDQPGGALPAGAALTNGLAQV